MSNHVSRYDYTKIACFGVLYKESIKLLKVGVILVSINELSNEEFKDRVEEIYDKFSKDLDNSAKNIIEFMDDTFKKILKDNNKYELIHNNGVITGNYYKFSYRVKGSKSLGDKLVRKSDLLKLRGRLIKNNNEVQEVIKFLRERYSDLIGIKILGDLHYDEINIFKLIKGNLDRFKDDYKEITFLNLDKQPQPMENGLEIFRIDCIYSDIVTSQDYKFELQIKSQLMSAWADMEHQQYYKNYTFNPIRNTSQPIMNEVGKLIYQTEELLIRIRNSEKDFKEVQNRIQFTSELNEKYGNYLMSSLSIQPEPMLTNIAGALHILSEKLQPDEESLLALLASEDRYELIHIEDDDLANYIEMRDSDFHIQILEAIVLLWYKSKNIYLGNKESYQSAINNFKEDYVIALTNTYKINGLAKIFNEFFHKLFEELPSPEIYLNVSLYKDITAFFKQSHDEWQRSFGEYEEILKNDSSDEDNEDEGYSDDEELYIHEGFITINLIYALRKFDSKFKFNTLKGNYGIEFGDVSKEVIEKGVKKIYEELIKTFETSESEFLNEIKEICLTFIKG